MIKPQSWSELGLDGHTRRLRISLTVYFVSLAVFWCHMSGLINLPLFVLLFFVVLGPANFLFLVWTAARIQDVLQASGLQKQGAWQVWVGAILLSPVVLGCYTPLSVMFSSGRIRRKLKDGKLSQSHLKKFTV